METLTEPKPLGYVFLRVIIRILSILNQIIVFAFFLYNLAHGKDAWLSTLVLTTACFTTGLICARAAWVCEPCAWGLLPLHQQPRFLALLLAIPFGMFQMVMVILIYQELAQQAEAALLLERMEIGTEQDRPARTPMLLPWRRRRESPVQGEVVEGISLSLAFIAVQAFNYWALHYPTGKDGHYVVDRIMPPPFNNANATSLFLNIMGWIAFSCAAASCLELDHAASVTVGFLVCRKPFYILLHLLFRCCELICRVWLHVVAVVLLWGHGFSMTCVSFSLAATWLIIVFHGGLERSRRGCLLQIGLAGLCVFVDLFYFVDLPQEQHAARRISRCLFARNALECLLVPCFVFLAAIMKPDLYDHIPHHFFTKNTLSWLGCLVCVLCYGSLWSLLPRFMPKPLWNIFAACRQDDHETLHVALGAATGPDLNRPDSDGYTPLMLAAQHGYCEICKLLMFNGARVDLPLRPSYMDRRLAGCMDRQPQTLGWTAAHLCARQGTATHASTLQHLLRNAPQPVAGRNSSSVLVDGRGDTPLHTAARYNRVEVFRVGGNLEPGMLQTTNDNGQLPVDLATDAEITSILQAPPSVIETPQSPGDWLPRDEDGKWPVSHIQIRAPGPSEPVRSVSSFVMERGSRALGDLLCRVPETIPEEEVPEPIPDSDVPDGGNPSFTVTLNQLLPCNRHTGESLKPVASPTIGQQTEETQANLFGGIPAWRAPPVEAFIGGGAYGRVFRAREQSSDGPGCFCIKVIEAPSARLAMREYQVSEYVRQRPHPCVVTVFDVVEEEVTPRRRLLLVMEFCPGPRLEMGCDLYSAIRYFADLHGSGVAPLAEVKIWMAEVFLGLEHLHLRMKAMIRDLKHANVVLTAEGQAKLADFGLGRLDVCAPNREWTFGSPPGTPGWAAPEIFQRSPYTFTCDFYSLGVLLWVLLTGGVNGRGNPPHHSVGNDIWVHRGDHQLLRRAVDNPRENSARPTPAGPARELVEQLIAPDSSQRGTHSCIRNHPFLSQVDIPDFSAAPAQVTAWASSHASRAHKLSISCQSADPVGLALNS